MDGDMKFERYMEKVLITQWKDGCVYATQSMGCDWFPGDVIDGQRPGETNIMYVAASDEFARNNMTIRRA